MTKFLSTNISFEGERQEGRGRGGTSNTGATLDFGVWANHQLLDWLVLDLVPAEIRLYSNGVQLISQIGATVPTFNLGYVRTLFSWYHLRNFEGSSQVSFYSLSFCYGVYL